MELYQADLQLISRLLGYVEDISNNEGVTELEIRVRIFEDDQWVVLGWGMSGDPAIIRFESDKPMSLAIPIVPRSGFISTPADTPFRATINKLKEYQDDTSQQKRCSCGEFSYHSNGTCGPSGCSNRPA